MGGPHLLLHCLIFFVFFADDYWVKAGQGERWWSASCFPPSHLSSGSRRSYELRTCTGSGLGFVLKMSRRARALINSWIGL